MGCCGSTERTKREWRPLEERSCTDLPWFLLFIIFCVGMGSVCAFTVVTGGAARLVFGYDSYGNTCGRRNQRVDDVKLSGLDHTDRKFVFFLDPCNIDIVQRKIKSVALCVSLCPSEVLNTYQDLMRFAMVNGSELCSYELAGHKYPGLPERFSKCPKLPVPPSKPLPLFNRCTPLDIACYTKFAEAVVTFVSDNSFLHRVIAGVAASKEVIMGLCLLALMLSMLLMVIIRYISAVLVWILTSLAVLGSLAGTSVLWWFYVDHRLHGNETHTKVTKEDEPMPDGNQTLLVYAIAATVFTVILLLLMLFMRKRVALAIALFHVAGKVFIHLPLLTLQPFITFLLLLVFWIYWILVLLFLGTSGDPVHNEETGLIEFRLTGPLEYLTWYHAVGLVWITEFILACQQMTVAGAVVTYYFTRDKKRLPAWPIVRAALRLLRYHVGTVAKGSFIITLVKIPRLLLIYVSKQLKGKENACARCVLKSCICCLWCLEKCLNYLNQNAYAATAINSTSFCTSARDAFVLLVENALRVATVNAIGDLVLFLGKILIVTTTAFAGVLLLNARRDYAEWLLPLVIVCLFAFLVAHCFLSVFEMVVDVLFLCFAIDTKYNDGTPGKEFFMDKALMEFVESSRRMERVAGRGRSRVKATTSEGAEMKPMVSDGDEKVTDDKSASEELGAWPKEVCGEWEDLQEFQVYYLLVGVLVDWALTEHSDFVLCLSEDVVLFLCVYLPTSTLFLFVSLLHTPNAAPPKEPTNVTAKTTTTC
ncbi:choline transporter-like protein 1 isoform X2 [Dunckerocampus dactyliophorus]|uniref:choline transporter-like protein 1 isoform X2 n=1 Tax=Dunckerocampus dactyliophorus TaxID=161453 RepID=UPI00240737B4|nr:choline transporter-like protein 1 isoform X2 [Dunckerocampus dactyliophorus]XP_054649062.1 choline transporter-like protein 1 isoform X2 [Dunckerocampus dactyliophorus]XP_054649063.1 choline transporter-like protein 1 isoform X2 [Dunckerocampus dactyliophorus]XP_054649064.1 choline transporter-like protein 1 isoform X2 [Dunckerocampus dactyliophorus]